MDKITPCLWYNHTAEEAATSRGQDEAHARTLLQLGLDHTHDPVHGRQTGALRRGHADLELCLVHVGRDVILPHNAI